MTETELLLTAERMVAKHGPEVAWQHALARAVEQTCDMSGLLSWALMVDVVDEITTDIRR